MRHTSEAVTPSLSSGRWEYRERVERFTTKLRAEATKGDASAFLTARPAFILEDAVIA